MNEKIRLLVSKLREALPSLELANIVDDLEESVENLGIKVLYSDMSDLDERGDSVSGFVRVNPRSGQPEIVINANESFARQRFTIAHELGHIFLHWKWIPGKALDSTLAEITFRHQLTYDGEDIIREKEANEFAAELLLPLKEVGKIKKSYFDFGKSGNNKFIEIVIAKKYKVSQQVVSIQLEKARGL